MKVSTILDNAAEKHLSRGNSKKLFRPHPDYRDPSCAKRAFSCEAIIKAEGLWDRNGPWEQLCASSKAIAFVKGLGMKPKAVNQFDEFPPGPARQAARYAWLKFAAARARELDV